MKKIFSFLFCAIFFCSFIISPSMAAEYDYPDISDFIDEVSTKNHYGYVIVLNSSSKPLLHVFSSVSTADVDFVIKGESDTYFSLTLQDETGARHNFSYTTYVAEDGVWSRTTGFTNTLQSNPLGRFDWPVIVSTHDIYNYDGTLFFQVTPTEVTLAEAIQMVVEQAIPVTETIIQGQMMIIVLCGVGCLALLISLVLLVKVLRRYLLR